MPTTITGNTGVSQVQAGATSDGLPLFQCRAWVNFDGTRDSTGAASTANTARFIRASGNVSSVVRNGTGDYTVNFTTAMPDANYAPVCTAGATALAGTTGSNRMASAGANTTGSFRLSCTVAGGAMTDFDYVTAAVFR